MTHVLAASCAILALVLLSVACAGTTLPPGAVPLKEFQDKLGLKERYTREGRDVPYLITWGREVATGKQAFQACTACHKMEYGGAITGPSLIGVGERYTKVLGDPLTTRLWLHHKIHDPNTYWGLATNATNRGTMTSFGMKYTPDQIEAIVEYLMSLK